MEEVNSSSLRSALNCPKLQKFWERCSVDERRLISSVDKVAVVKKMKERFKHRCECHDCRKGKIYFEHGARFVDEIVERLEIGGKQIALLGDSTCKQILYKSAKAKQVDIASNPQLPEQECCAQQGSECKETEDSSGDCTSNIFVFDDMIYIYQGQIYLRDSLLKKKTALGFVGDCLEHCHLQWKSSKSTKPCEFCQTLWMFETTVCILMEEKVHKMLHQKEAEEKASKVLEQLLKEVTTTKPRKKKKKTKYVTKKDLKFPTNDEVMDDLSSDNEELQSQDLQKEAAVSVASPIIDVESWDGVATKKGVKLFKKQSERLMISTSSVKTEHLEIPETCQHAPCLPQIIDFSYFCLHQEMKDVKYQQAFHCYGNCFALPTLFSVPPFLYQ